MKEIHLFVYSSVDQTIEQVSEIGCGMSIPEDNKEPIDHNLNQPVVVHFAVYSLFAVYSCVWFCLCFYPLYLEGSLLS